MTWNIVSYANFYRFLTKPNINYYLDKIVPGQLVFSEIKNLPSENKKEILGFITQSKNMAN